MARVELHFGSSLGGSSEATVEQAQRLEELGYDFVAQGEHFMRGNPPTPTQASIPILAVAAGATRRVRLVSSIVLIPFYHPTVLAKLTTSLDIASRGRFTLGIGVGGEFPLEFEAAGLSARQRGGRANEGLELLKRLWTEEHVTYQGRYFQVKDVTLKPVPTQKPHPPIWVAGRRDAAMRRAAIYGDGWFPYLYSPERYRESLEKIRAYAAQEGRDLSDFQWANYQFISIYDSREEAAQVAARRLGARYIYSGDFAGIVGSYCILGPVRECIRRLEEYIEAGARHIMFAWACPPEELPRHMETVAREIIPYFKG